MIEYTEQFIENLDGTKKLVSILAKNGPDMFWIPIDEGNSDYQQYLVDTDGGLPTPKQTEGE